MNINLDAFTEFTDVVLKSDRLVSIYQYKLLESVLKVILDFNKAEISVCLDRDLRLYRHLCKEMPKKIRSHNYMCCCFVDCYYMWRIFVSSLEGYLNERIHKNGYEFFVREGVRYMEDSYTYGEIRITIMYSYSSLPIDINMVCRLDLDGIVVSVFELVSDKTQSEEIEDLTECIVNLANSENIRGNLYSVAFSVSRYEALNYCSFHKFKGLTLKNIFKDFNLNLVDEDVLFVCFAFLSPFIEHKGRDLEWDSSKVSWVERG